jgi:hypothetical protein
MTDPREHDRPPDPGLPPGEPAEIVNLARRLEEERPVPRAGFRAALRSKLLTAGREQAWAGGRLRLRIAAYAGSGVVLLAIAAVGVAGAGPLAAG